MIQEIDKVASCASLEIGKVSLERIIRFSPEEQLALYGIFFQEIFQEKLIFEPSLLSGEHEDYPLIVCVPNTSNFDIGKICHKIGEYFKFDDDLLLRYKMKEERRFEGNYAICTSIRPKTTNSIDYILNRQSQFMTLLETQIFWLFFHWLSGSNWDSGSVLVISPENFNGSFMLFDCLSLEIYSQFISESDDHELFHTRELIYKC